MFNQDQPIKSVFNLHHLNSHKNVSDGFSFLKNKASLLIRGILCTRGTDEKWVNKKKKN